jgi:hypothetical protein
VLQRNHTPYFDEVIELWMSGHLSLLSLQMLLEHETYFEHVALEVIPSSCLLTYCYQQFQHNGPITMGIALTTIPIYGLQLLYGSLKIYFIWAVFKEDTETLQNILA